MMISTRGRYALRVLLELAESQKEGYIAMKQVAMRQELSLKYIEQIMPVLSKNHYVEGVQGERWRIPSGKSAGRVSGWRYSETDRGQSCSGSLSGMRCQNVQARKYLQNTADVEGVSSDGSRLF